MSVLREVSFSHINNIFVLAQQVAHAFQVMFYKTRVPISNGPVFLDLRPNAIIRQACAAYSLMSPGTSGRNCAN